MGNCGGAAIEQNFWQVLGVGARAPNKNRDSGPKTRTGQPRPFLPLKKHSRPVGVLAIVAGRRNPTQSMFPVYTTTLRTERMTPQGS